MSEAMLESSRAASPSSLPSQRNARPPVLMYHHIGHPSPGAFPELTILPEQFEEQVRWLARHGYQGIEPTDWLGWRQEGKELPEKPVLLTFDDAYEELVEYALPVICRYGFSAVIYVVTGHIGGTNVFDQARGGAVRRLMSAAQIREWAGRGIEFGAHSRTHADLGSLTAAELEKEVVGSRDDLAEILGAPPLTFAYPDGFYNDAVLTHVRSAFALAFTTEEGLNDFDTDAHLLRRSMVWPGDTLFALRCHMRWGWHPVRRLRRSLARAWRQFNVRGA